MQGTIPLRVACGPASEAPVGRRLASTGVSKLLLRECGRKYDQADLSIRPGFLVLLAFKASPSGISLAWAICMGCRRQRALTAGLGV